MNMLGNIFLVFEYDHTTHYLPKIPIWRRLVNSVISVFIFWTYPDVVVQKYANALVLTD